MKKYSSTKGLTKLIKSTDDFISKAKEFHGDKFDYSLVNFENLYKKVTIICQIHGEFTQQPINHLSNHGCTYCGQHKHTQKSVMDIVTNLHPSLDFSKLIYKNLSTKVDVTCNICHTEFKPNLRNLIHRKSGCPKCGNSLKRTTEGFIKECQDIYGDLYDYTPLIYTGIHDPVMIYCKKHKTDFSVDAANHLRYGTGCDECKKDKSQSIGEAIIENKLKKMNIDFIREHSFDDCKNTSHLYFDFFIPELNLCIEYDGEQHFKVVKKWGGEKGLIERQKRDNIKNQYCIDNGIKLIRISYKFKRKLVEKLIAELQPYLK